MFINTPALGIEQLLELILIATCDSPT